MSKHSGNMPPRRIWRVSASAPQGEYVDSQSGEARVEDPKPAVVSDMAETGWMQSSMDLAQGLEVIDRTDSMSNEWFGRWFGQ
jgi:hypothetical protein